MKATCNGCYNSLKLFLSPPRPSRNKRAMTPFSEKTTMLGKPKRKRFNPLRSHPVPLERTKRSPYLEIVIFAVKCCVWRGKTAQSWLLRVRSLFNLASQRPRLTLNKFLCDPLSLCTRRSLEAQNRSLRKGAPSTSNFNEKCRLFRATPRKGIRYDPLKQRKVLQFCSFQNEGHG